MSIRRLRDAVVGLEPGCDKTPTAKLRRLMAELRAIGSPTALDAAEILAGVAEYIGDVAIDPPTCSRCGRYVKSPLSKLCKSCAKFRHD